MTEIVPMASVEELKRPGCRVCKLPAEQMAELFTLGDHYVNDFVSTTDRRPRQDGVRVPIVIELCGNCGLVQQRYSAPLDRLYRDHYWYRSGTTATMRAALRDVAHAVWRMMPLVPGDVILDIGSNDGTFLRHCADYKMGTIQYGIEPADNLATFENYGAHGLLLGHGYWSREKYYGLIDRPARVITALGMLYDLENPLAFLTDVAKCLAPDGVFIAQLQCLKQTVELGDVGNFCHEHLEFYSLHTLMALFIAAGLEVFDVEENAVNGGSYRLFARHTGVKEPERPGGEGRVERALVKERQMNLTDPRTYRDLYMLMDDQRKACVAFIRQQRWYFRKRVWVYGASTKGNTILQWYGLDRAIIQGAADRSPEKAGKMTVGTWIPIYTEEEARAAVPDFFLVLPYAFIEEFKTREASEQWRQDGGKFIVPLPKFQVV